MIQSDEGLKLETSVFESFTRAFFTLLTLLIIIFVSLNHRDSAHNFFS